ncbi:MAG: GerMN domain-containing protein, partial [Treponema sp.]|nr:GerMN domain-containing protein [Treponema sp.]
ADTRERGIFLIQMENEGADLQLTRVNRTLSASETPLIDTLNALFLGPTAEESARGIISFIPPNSQILSVRVEGHTVGNARRDTAYINFNESFQFTPYGREGLRYQIWQIVYTATEFPNVHDVQILIEGNRVDFLHEGGIRIGSPIGR